MGTLDIILVGIVLIVLFFAIKSVRNSIKSGGCAGCSHSCDCKKRQKELERGYKEWQEKQKNKA